MGGEAEPRPDAAWKKVLVATVILYVMLPQLEIIVRYVCTLIWARWQLWVGLLREEAEQELQLLEQNRSDRDDDSDEDEVFHEANAETQSESTPTDRAGSGTTQTYVKDAASGGKAVHDSRGGQERKTEEEDASAHIVRVQRGRLQQDGNNAVRPHVRQSPTPSGEDHSEPTTDGGHQRRSRQPEFGRTEVEVSARDTEHHLQLDSRFPDSSSTTTRVSDGATANQRRGTDGVQPVSPCVRENEVLRPDSAQSNGRRRNVLHPRSASDERHEGTTERTSRWGQRAVQYRTGWTLNESRQTWTRQQDWNDSGADRQFGRGRGGRGQGRANRRGVSTDRRPGRPQQPRNSTWGYVSENTISTPEEPVILIAEYTPEDFVINEIDIDKISVHELVKLFKTTQPSTTVPFNKAWFDWEPTVNGWLGKYSWQKQQARDAAEGWATKTTPRGRRSADSTTRRKEQRVQFLRQRHQRRPERDNRNSPRVFPTRNRSSTRCQPSNDDDWD